MAGRRPKPTALKILEGNPGKRPLNHKEPVPDGLPECPAHLNEVAREEWRTMVQVLSPARLVTAADRTALACYCQTYAAWVEDSRELAAVGSTTTTEKGYRMADPLVGIVNTHKTLMLKFLIEFGMTPASRSRLQIEAPQKEEDKLATFLRRPRRANNDGDEESIN